MKFYICVRKCQRTNKNFLKEMNEVALRCIYYRLVHYVCKLATEVVT